MAACEGTPGTSLPGYRRHADPSAGDPPL